MALTSVTHTTVDAIRDRILEDQRRMLVAAGVSRPALGKGSERYIRAESVAAVAMGIVAKEVALQDAQMPDKAMDEDLERLCELNNVEKSDGAGASGYVLPEVEGTIAFVEGQELTAPDGLRYQVVETTIAYATSVPNARVPVVGIDTGKRTNKAAGTIFTWTSPPSGSSATCTADVDGIRFGADADTNTTLRTKLLYKLRHPPRGGNSAQIKEDAESASAAIERAYVYPAVYGPSTMHVALVAPAEEDYAYTREVPGALQISAASSVISAHPEHADITLTTVEDYDVDLVLKVTLPEPKEVGGIGGGWRDPAATRWPTSFNSAAPKAVSVSASPSNGLQIRVLTDSAPVAGAYIAIWSTLKKKLARTRVYSSSSVGGGVYVVDLYTPIDTTWFAFDPSLFGDFVMPDAEHLEDYCATIAASFASLGPGQKTTTATKLPRSYRRPLVQEIAPCDYTSSNLGALSIVHPEVSNVIPSYAYAPDKSAITSIPPIPCPVAAASPVGSAPYLLRLGRLALYPA